MQELGYPALISIQEQIELSGYVPTPVLIQRALLRTVPVAKRLDQVFRELLPNPALTAQMLADRYQALEGEQQAAERAIQKIISGSCASHPYNDPAKCAEVVQKLLDDAGIEYQRLPDNPAGETIIVSGYSFGPICIHIFRDAPIDFNAATHRYIKRDDLSDEEYRDASIALTSYVRAVNSKLGRGLSDLLKALTARLPSSTTTDPLILFATVSTRSS